MKEDAVITLLLDIKQEQGVMAQQLLEASRSRGELKDGQAAAAKRIEDLQAAVQPLTTAMADMHPKVEEFDKFRLRIGAYIWLGGIIAAAVVALLWQGLLNLWPTIKQMLHG